MRSGTTSNEATWDAIFRTKKQMWIMLTVTCSTCLSQVMLRSTYAVEAFMSGHTQLKLSCQVIRS